MVAPVARTARLLPSGQESGQAAPTPVAGAACAPHETTRERRKIQARVELLLDKVSREGINSLTDAERRELIDASRFFQR